MSYLFKVQRYERSVSNIIFNDFVIREYDTVFNKCNKTFLGFEETMKLFLLNYNSLFAETDERDETNPCINTKETTLILTTRLKTSKK